MDTNIYQIRLESPDSWVEYEVHAIDEVRAIDKAEERAQDEHPHIDLTVVDVELIHKDQ